MDMTGEPYPKRRIDSMSGLMIMVTFAALSGTAWMRFGRGSGPEGFDGRLLEAPPLRLIDPETAEPVVLVGLNSKVVWVVFSSATAHRTVVPGGAGVGHEAAPVAPEFRHGHGGRRVG